MIAQFQKQRFSKSRVTPATATTIVRCCAVKSPSDLSHKRILSAHQGKNARNSQRGAAIRRRQQQQRHRPDEVPPFLPQFVHLLTYTHLSTRGMSFLFFSPDDGDRCEHLSVYPHPRSSALVGASPQSSTSQPASSGKFYASLSSISFQFSNTPSEYLTNQQARDSSGIKVLRSSTLANH